MYITYLLNLYDLMILCSQMLASQTLVFAIILHKVFKSSVLHSASIANNHIQMLSNFMNYTFGKSQALDTDFHSDKIMPQQMHICSLKDTIRLCLPKL